MAKTAAVFLNGNVGCSDSQNGLKDHNFYVIFNAYDETVIFKLPDARYANEWIAILDTNQKPATQENGIYQPGASLTLPGRSIAVLRSTVSGIV